jgi:hypothetical protein
MIFLFFSCIKKLEIGVDIEEIYASSGLRDREKRTNEN